MHKNFVLYGFVILFLTFAVHTAGKTVTWTVTELVNYHRQYSIQRLIMECQTVAATVQNNNWEYRDCLENLGVLEYVKENKAKYQEAAATSLL